MNYLNQQTPLWVSSSGTNSVSFNKLDAPPLAYYNKGILYELNDGKLYYNGTEISGGGDVDGPASSVDNALARFDGTSGKLLQNSAITLSDTADLAGVKSLDLTAVAANPGGADTLWLDSATSALMIGADPVNWVINDVANYSIEIASTNTDLTGGGHFIANQTGAPNLVAGAYENTVVGLGAGSQLTGGSYNTLYGSSAGGSLTSGSSLTAIGWNAGARCTTASNGTFVGRSAGLNSNGAENTYIGYAAGECALGSTGTSNTCVGEYSGQVISSGNANTLVGISSGRQISTGSDNTAFGSNTCRFLTTGSSNIVIGQGAASTLTTGSNNITIAADVAAAAESGTIRIGTNATHTSAYVQGIYDYTGSTAGFPVVVESDGRLGVNYSANKFAQISATNSGNTVNLTLNTPYAIGYGATFVESAGSDWAQNGGSILRYNGDVDRVCKLDIDLSFANSNAGDLFKIDIACNGTAIASTSMAVSADNSGRYHSVHVSAVKSLTFFDGITIQITNLTGNSTITLYAWSLIGTY